MEECSEPSAQTQPGGVIHDRIGYHDAGCQYDALRWVDACGHAARCEADGDRSVVVERELVGRLSEAVDDLLGDQATELSHDLGVRNAC